MAVCGNPLLMGIGMTDLWGEIDWLQISTRNVFSLTLSLMFENKGIVMVGGSARSGLMYLFRTLYDIKFRWMRSAVFGKGVLMWFWGGAKN